MLRRSVGRGIATFEIRLNLSGMSAAEIIRELPKLTEADRRAIREVLL